MTRKKLKPSVLIFLCWLIYTCSCIGKYSFNSNITLIEQSFKVTHADSGLVTTLFFLAYGAGQIINGIFCKRYNKRIVLSVSVLISAGINIGVAVGMPFTLMKYFWFINGAVLSVLWSSVISVLAEHLDEKNLKWAIIVMSTTVPAGTCLSYGASALFSLTGKYNWAFLFAGCICAVVGIIWLLTYSKKSFEIHEDFAGEKPKISIEKQQKSKVGVGIFIVLAVLALFAIVTNLTKDGLQTWVPTILKESFLLSDSLSIILTIVLPILGMFGAILATLLYKYVKDFVLLTGIFFIAGTLCVLGVLLLLKTTLWLPVILLFGLTVMFMFSANNVITSIVPMYSRDKLDSGRVSGILNGFCYVGSTISSYGLGAVAVSYGWNSVVTLLLIVCGVVVGVSVIYSVILAIRSKKKYKNF